MEVTSKVTFPSAIVYGGEIIAVYTCPTQFTYGVDDSAILHPESAWELWTSDDWASMCPDWTVLPLIDVQPSEEGKKAEKLPWIDWEISESAVTVSYVLVDMTEEDIAAAKPAVPSSITNFQARAALLTAGLFSQVNDTLLSLPVESAERQAWEYANEITRGGTLVNSMAAQLGWTQTQLDELFRIGATMEA